MENEKCIAMFCGSETPVRGEDWVHFQSMGGGGIKFHHVNLQHGNSNFLLPNLQKCSSGPGFCSSKLSWRYPLVCHCLAPHSPVPWGSGERSSTLFPRGGGGGWITSLPAHLAFSWRDVLWQLEICRHKENGAKWDQPWCEIWRDEKISS